MSGMSGGDLRSSLPPRPVRASIEEGTLFILDCYPIKDALKAFGFKWEAPLKAWAKPIPTYQMQSVLSDIRNLCAEISIPFHEETRDSGPSRAPATPSRQQTAAQQQPQPETPSRAEATFVRAGVRDERFVIEKGFALKEDLKKAHFRWDPEARVWWLSTKNVHTSHGIDVLWNVVRKAADAAGLELQDLDGKPVGGAAAPAAAATHAPDNDDDVDVVCELTQRTVEARRFDDALKRGDVIDITGTPSQAREPTCDVAPSPAKKAKRELMPESDDGPVLSFLRRLKSDTLRVICEDLEMKESGDKEELLSRIARVV